MTSAQYPALPMVVNAENQPDLRDSDGLLSLKTCYSGDEAGHHSMAAQSTVLIAEDDQTIREILVDLLADEGYALHVAVDGQDALGLAATRHVDLILLDLQMPVLNGHEFCQGYRAIGGRAPVVLLTASSGDIIEQAVVSCGAAGYIAKPFDLDHLLAVIGVHIPSKS